MSHRIVLEVPDELYQSLVARAEREGKTIEEIAVSILEKWAASEANDNNSG